MSTKLQIAVIGGGAAGFFSAIAAKNNFPDADVVLLEKSGKTLSKVRISGGGRCNVTNGTQSIKELADGYPRGGKQLKNLFTQFGTRDTFNWFESRSVPLYVQEDGRVFPKSDDSRSIVDCLYNEINRLGIQIELNTPVTSIKEKDGKIELTLSKSVARVFDKVIVATGGSPKESGLHWLADLGHDIETPVPSLFTFNIPDKKLTELMGVVAANALVSIQGTKLKTSGPLLITHWGMSGPAVLKLSSFGARTLHQMNYNFTVQVNWTGQKNAETIRSELAIIARRYPGKLLRNIRPFDISERLWLFLISKTDLPSDKVWGELGKKGLNQIVHVLTNDLYRAEGKTTFKEEFVTCGGISLNSVNMKTMESKVCPNLYFSGELLDIDGITGGYNFQAAWTTAFIAGQLNK